MSAPDAPAGERQSQAEDDVLVRFLDGPLASQGNVRNMGGGRDFVLPRRVYGWPLPDRLRALTHPGVANVALWDPDGDGDDLPDEILHSPNAVTYRKVSESQIPDEAAARMSHVVRGAQYELELQ